MRTSRAAHPPNQLVSLEVQTALRRPCIQLSSVRGRLSAALSDAGAVADGKAAEADDAVCIGGGRHIYQKCRRWSRNLREKIGMGFARESGFRAGSLKQSMMVAGSVGR